MENQVNRNINTAITGTLKILALPHIVLTPPPQFCHFGIEGELSLFGESDDFWGESGHIYFIVCCHHIELAWKSGYNELTDQDQNLITQGIAGKLL